MVCLYGRELVLSHFVVLLPSNLVLRVISSLENGEKLISLQHLKKEKKKKTRKKTPHYNQIQKKTPKTPQTKPKSCTKH